MNQKERADVLQNCFDTGFFCDCMETVCADDGWTEVVQHRADCSAVEGLIELLEAMK